MHWQRVDDRVVREMTVDIDSLMRELAQRRPVFHSEADFQFALSRQIEVEERDYEVRLERPFRSGRRSRRVDIWLPHEEIAVELKYFTRRMCETVGDEVFDLKDHAATDLARYRFLADVQRLEGLLRDGAGAVRTGFAVLLTNAPGMWERPSRRTNDGAFLVYDGRKDVTGKLQWSKDGSLLIDDEISLGGSYTMNWKDYSDVVGVENGRFRYLCLSVLFPD